MRQFVTSRLGGEYGVRESVAEEVTVERKANLGFIYDRHTSPARDREAMIRRVVTFRKLFRRTIENVFVAEDHIVFDDSSIYIDNAIDAVDLISEQRAQAIGQRYQARINASGAAAKEKVVVEGPVILTSNEGSGTWGHWVVHNFPRVAAVARDLPHTRILVPASYYGVMSNFGELLTLSGINEDRIVKSHPNQVYCIETAIVPDYLYANNAIHPLAVDILESIAPFSEVGPRTSRRRLFIKRATSNKRSIVNEKEFEITMLKHEFETRLLGAEPLKHQIDTWRASQSVASVLGSDLANMVFAQDASIVAFTPSHFGDNFFFDLAAAKGFVWNEMICAQIADRQANIGNSNFIVNADELEDVLSKVVM